MARDGIRLDTRQFDQRLRIYRENLVRAAQNAMTKAGKAAVSEMRSVVVTAPNTTKGAGRFETGAMLESLTVDGATKVEAQKNGGIHVRFGFINGPHYSRFQERGTARGIIPMGAIAQGRIVFEIVMKQELKRQARQAGDRAMAMKYLKEEQALKKRLAKSRAGGAERSSTGRTGMRAQRTRSIRAAQTRRTK